MSVVKKGKATISAGSEYVEVTFSAAFSQTPIVNISCKDNVNVYLIDITTNNFKAYISSTLDNDLEINYVAIGSS